MPRRKKPTTRRAKLSKRTVDALKPEGERYEVLDTVLPGFRCRVSPSGVKTFAVVYRDAHGRLRRHTIGKLGSDVTPDQARDAAEKARQDAKQGHDPAAAKKQLRETPTLGRAIDVFLALLEPSLAPRTFKTYEQRLEKYVRPAFGTTPITEVKQAQVRRLHAKITRAGHPVAANRVVETLRRLYSWARTEWPELVGANPAKFGRDALRRNAEDQRERILTAAERKKLLAAIETAEQAGPRDKGSVAPTYAAAFKLISATGMRPIDVVSLRFENITRGVAGKRKIWVATWPQGTKKANQRRVLNSEAIRIIEVQRGRLGGASEGYVFPASSGKQSTSNQLARSFRRMREVAKLPEDVTLYAFRHSYVSEAVMAGIPLAVVGADVDNAHAVQRYAHLQRAVDEGVSERVLEAMRGGR